MTNKINFYTDTKVTGTLYATTQGSGDNAVVLVNSHKVLSGSSAPTESTVGFPGQMYKDTSSNGAYYICTAKTVGETETTYTWATISSKVKLNGTNTTYAQFYAPTAGGTAQSILVSTGNGADNAPVWSNALTIDTTSKAISVTGVASSTAESVNITTKAFRNIVAGTAAPTSSTPSGANVGDVYLQYGGTPHLGSINKGSTTKPVYFSAGEALECSTYAGGTAVTLNGTPMASSSISIYAPTVAGTAGYFLTSNGSGAPTWTPLVGPMVFKGTVGSSSATYTWANWASWTTHKYSIGWTYKVDLDSPSGNYPTCKAGDTLICNVDPNGAYHTSDWVVVPSGDEPSGTVTSVATGTGLTGGPITSSGTISVDTSYVLSKTDTDGQTVVGEIRSTKNTSSAGLPVTDTAFRNITAGTTAPTSSSPSGSLIGDVYLQYGDTPHLGSINVGNTTTPVYFEAGGAKACTGSTVKRDVKEIISWGSTETSATVNFGFRPNIVQVYETSYLDGAWTDYEQVYFRITLNSTGCTLESSAALTDISSTHKLVCYGIGW